MKKRTKLVAGLLAGVMAISAMAFGFAQWSTDITLTGSVAASGKWDVAITDASVDLSNAGAAFTETTVYEGSGYPVELNYIESTGYYVLRLRTAEVVDFVVDSGEKAGSVYYNVNWGNADTYYTDGAPSKSGYYNVYLTAGLPTDKGLGYSATVKANDGGASNGQQVGYVTLYGGTLTEKTLVNDSVAVEATSAVYPEVDFSLPGAWANYSVTIANNGTANANLKDYAFDVSALDEDIYTVDTPDLTDDILAPGASCTFNFVVQVDTEAAELDADAASFTVTLKYAQDEVNAAPSAGHNH